MVPYAFRVVHTTDSVPHLPPSSETSDSSVSDYHRKEKYHTKKHETKKNEHGSKSERDRSRSRTQRERELKNTSKRKRSITPPNKDHKQDDEYDRRPVRKLVRDSGYYGESWRSRSKNYNDRCIYCNYPHYSDECPIVTDPAKRRDILDNQGRCMACYGMLRDNVPQRCRQQPFFFRRTVYEFLITGHSLGGAMATLTAFRISFRNISTRIKVHTFGEPRVGDISFAKNFNAMVPYAFRVVHATDPVPHLPPLYVGNPSENGKPYHHPREIWYNNDFTNYVLKKK